ncbi:MAG: hypothetical protein A3K04_12810 [Gallionellales bacterium RBG_16_56_9]|nr:MAG: hypothetical protein A3K04_12810 [Gallionellales bacterium RBG_16_56_9]
MESVKDHVFKGKNLDDQVVNEINKTISIDQRNAVNVCLESNFFYHRLDIGFQIVGDGHSD